VIKVWNQQTQTDRTIPNNKLDIVIQDSEKGKCVLIDFSISGDRNVIKNEAEKSLKYKDLIVRRFSTHEECKNESDTSNNRGN
jgi:hypothetical protein